MRRRRRRGGDETGSEEGRRGYSRRPGRGLGERDTVRGRGERGELCPPPGKTDRIPRRRVIEYPLVAARGGTRWESDCRGDALFCGMGRSRVRVRVVRRTPGVLDDRVCDCYDE